MSVNLRELMRKEKERRAAEVIRKGDELLKDATSSVTNDDKNEHLVKRIKLNNTEERNTGIEIDTCLPADFFDYEENSTETNCAGEIDKNSCLVSTEAGEWKGNNTECLVETANNDVDVAEHAGDRKSINLVKYNDANDETHLEYEEEGNELDVRERWAKRLEEEVEGVRYVEELLEVCDANESLLQPAVPPAESSGVINEHGQQASRNGSDEEIYETVDDDAILSHSFSLEDYDYFKTAYYSNLSDYKEKERRRIEEEKDEMNLSVDNLKNAGKIPLGFFDDADRDAEARGKVGPTKRKLQEADQEVQIFEAEIDTEVEREEIIRHKLDAERFKEDFEVQRQVQRNLEERLRSLEKKRAILNAASVAAEIGNSTNMRDFEEVMRETPSIEDEEDWEDEAIAVAIDWRAKRAST